MYIRHLQFRLPFCGAKTRTVKCPSFGTATTIKRAFDASSLDMPVERSVYIALTVQPSSLVLVTS
ncbi:MAG: hypothetical protein IPH53_14405 [Flavobacteriales bacterium]|nr:hypothetical protein [Flavobacteriales bacterium]